MPGFPEFSLDRELQACVVTRELAYQIEKQLLDTEREAIGGEGFATERRFDASVIDAYGGETFQSVEDIPTVGFPNSTEAVRFFLESTTTDNRGEERSVRIKLAFREEHGNRLSIRLRGPQARERAIGLYERIVQLVESEDIDSKLFRPRDWVTGLLGLFLLFGGLAWFCYTCSLLASEPMGIESGSYWILTALLLTSGYYLAIVHLLFPQCAFETSRWMRLQEWRRWAAQALAGLVLIDGVLLAVGKRIMESLAQS